MGPDVVDSAVTGYKQGTAMATAFTGYIVTALPVGQLLDFIKKTAWISNPIIIANRGQTHVNDGTGSAKIAGADVVVCDGGRVS